MTPEEIQRQIEQLQQQLQALQGTNVQVGGNLVGGNQIGGHQYNAQGDLHIHQALDPAREARQTYLKRLRDHCHALPLAAMGDDQTTGESLGLDTVYIALDTQTRVPLSEEQQAERQKESWRFLDNREDLQSRPLTALEAAGQHSRLVLLGDPGSVPRP